MEHKKIGALFSVILAAAVGLSAQVNNHISANVVQGRVLDSAGTPLSDTAIELRGWNGQTLGNGISNSNGGFEFDTGIPGPYELLVHAPTQDVLVPIKNRSSNDMNGYDVRLPISSPPPAASGVEGNTVSYNDLAAPAKARERLDAAIKALDKQDYTHATQLSSQAIAIAPNWGRAYFVRGLLEMHFNDFTAAMADLRRAQAINPTDQGTLVALAKLYAAEGIYDQAGLCLQHALAAPVPSWQAHYEKANLDLQTGHYAEAEEMARAAINDTPPAHSVVYFLLAQAEFLENKRADAARDYTTFLTTTPPTPENENALALARKRLAMAQQP